jgi:phosphate/sulfate permease
MIKKIDFGVRFSAFATSVGSGAISLRAAYALATVVETAGGVLLGD